MRSELPEPCRHPIFRKSHLRSSAKNGKVANRTYKNFLTPVFTGYGETILKLPVGESARPIVVQAAIHRRDGLTLVEEMPNIFAEAEIVHGHQQRLGLFFPPAARVG